MKLATKTILALLVISTVSFAGHNTPEALEARTAPEGKLNVVAAGAKNVSRAALSGKEVYDRTCATCHAAGIAGAPKTGDASAWAARIAQGMNVMVQNAINGFQGETGVMLARGGNASLSDGEVEAAVRLMVERSQ